jgi:CHASE3 domain sensor protein
MKLEDLKIGTQMKMGFGIIVLLIILLGAISWQQTNKITQHTMDMYNHPFTVRKALGNLNGDILGMRLEFRNFLLASNNKDREIALTNSLVYEMDAEQQFLKLEDAYLGPQTDIVEARKAFISWVAVRNGNRELGKAGRIEEAMHRVQDVGDIGIERELMLKSISRIDQFASNKATEFLVGTTLLKDTLNRQLALLVALVLGLTILIDGG